MWLLLIQISSMLSKKSVCMSANSDRENGVCSDAKVSCTVRVILQFWAILNFLDLSSTVCIKFTATVMGTVMLRSAVAYYVYTMYVHI